MNGPDAPRAGEEFDAEPYTELHSNVFLSDYKLKIKTKVAILLDHSSSIADAELDYKRATVALCESLNYLGVKFAVYAFSTEKLQVQCWVIKPPNIRWSPVCARRLAQIRASGWTPLAEVYAQATGNKGATFGLLLIIFFSLMICVVGTFLTVSDSFFLDQAGD